jgi:5-methyltetrahydrofolate--homocysteine methyltransferase
MIRHLELTFEAGSDAVLTNSFGGSKIKLSAHGFEHRCYELNRQAAKIANEVKPEGKHVAGSMGPTGKFLEPQGEFTETKFEEAYAEQATEVDISMAITPPP